MHAAPDQQTAVAKANAAILVFILCCSLSTVRLVRDNPSPTRIQRDDISSRSDQRFAALKSNLPPTGVVGYIGETGDSATPDYYLTQYALAPLVVDQSPNHSVVVGNFPSSLPSQLPKNLQLIKDFGNGVLLFSSQDVNRKDAN
jgi:hypothetical protein